MDIRTLLYPLGFVATALFTLRVLLQWITSEKRQDSVVSATFWKISLLANALMAFHGLIQLQLPIALIQAGNAALSWRHLNLMSAAPCKKKITLTIISGAILGMLALFLIQGEILGVWSWMTPPTMPWTGKHAPQASFGWHLYGFFGMTLFASRYWVQWWHSEKRQESFLGKPFFWISLVGALCSLLYFVRLGDWVNILGYGWGCIPYMRNLILLRKKARPALAPALFLFAGEQSGDVLGGKLIRELKTLYPHLRLYGVGGEEMRRAGMEILIPTSAFQVMGISDVMRALPRLFSLFRRIKKEILQAPPLGVVLIDYPDFNMRLAKALRKGGYAGKLIHYVCPSVWAWRKKRIRTLVSTLDHLISILPFEKDHFAGTPLPVTFVGHPLVEAVENYSYRAESIPQGAPIFAIFPGSRRGEIEQNLPTQLQAAELFAQDHPGWAYCISVARPELTEEIEKRMAHVKVPFRLIPGHSRYELMRAAHLACATSGTVTLEMGLHQLPTVVTYRLPLLNYLVGRYLFRILLPYYALPNIIGGRGIFPEFVHRRVSSQQVKQALDDLLRRRQECQEACLQLKEGLYVPDTALKTAHTIGGILKL